MLTANLVIGSFQCYCFTLLSSLWISAVSLYNSKSLFSSKEKRSFTEMGTILTPLHNQRSNLAQISHRRALSGSPDLISVASLQDDSKEIWRDWQYDGLTWLELKFHPVYIPLGVVIVAVVHHQAPGHFVTLITSLFSVTIFLILNICCPPEYEADASDAEGTGCVHQRDQSNVASPEAESRLHWTEHNHSLDSHRPGSGQKFLCCRESLRGMSALKDYLHPHYTASRYWMEQFMCLVSRMN